MTERSVASFVALSAALTGFAQGELWSSGQPKQYLDELAAIVGGDLVAALLAAGDEALVAPDPDERLRALVLDDPALGPIARNLIVLWYLGQWDPMPGDWRASHGASPRDVAHVPSPEAYRAGLVWKAIGAHPMGGRPPGFASWTKPPPARGGAQA